MFRRALLVPCFYMPELNASYCLLKSQAILPDRPHVSLISSWEALAGASLRQLGMQAPGS